MTTKKNNQGQSKFEFRAFCIDCEKYVGKKKKTQEEAEADKKVHKNLPLNKNHEVRIERIQTS